MTPALDQVSNITDLLRSNADVFGDRTAVAVVGETRDVPEDALTFSQLDRDARRIAGWLLDRFHPGDRILLLYPTSVHFAAAFLGCVYAGMVAVPAPMPGRYQHQQRRVTAIARSAGASAVLTESAELPDVTNWIVQDFPGRLALLPTDTAELPEGPGSMPVTGRDTTVLLQYTSGSTGDPKGALVTHGNLLHNVYCLTRTLGLTSETKFGGWAPQFHDMGLIGHLLPSLFLGGGVVLMTPTAFLKRPHRWLQMIDDHGVALSMSPNFGYERCLRQITDEQLAQLDLSCWQFAAIGAEPVRGSVMRQFALRMAPTGFKATSFFPAYGMAEATLLISGTSGREPVVRRVDPGLLEDNTFQPVADDIPGREVVSVGIPRSLEVRIVEPRTREVVPPGRIGEIWLRGDSVTGGYWRNTTATEEAFRARTADGQGEFLRTGDLGVLYRDELYVTGRLKDMLIVNGRNLYPHDIEQELRDQHPELARLAGAAFTVEADGREHVVVAHEIRGRDTERLAETATVIRATVYKEFGVHVAAVVLLRPGGVLRTTSGKVQRSAMRRQFIAGLLDGVYERIDPHVAAMRSSDGGSDGAAVVTQEAL